MRSKSIPSLHQFTAVATRRAAIAVAVLLTFFTPALAASMQPLLPTNGMDVCYGRVYTASHLSEHPNQLITKMVILGTLFQGAYNFNIGLSVRGSNKVYITQAQCEQRSSNQQELYCYMDCDQGEFLLSSARTRGSIKLSLHRLAFAQTCDNEDGTDVIYEITSGLDDKEFRLDPVPLNDCNMLK